MDARHAHTSQLMRTVEEHSPIKELIVCPGPMRNEILRSLITLRKVPQDPIQIG